MCIKIICCFALSNSIKQFKTSNKMEKITYKGIEITLFNGYYIFYIDGNRFSNTNIRFTKVIINRELKKLQAK